MSTDTRIIHKKQIKKLQQILKNNKQKLKVKKKTISNLFRYESSIDKSRYEIDLSSFNKPLFLDSKNKILEVQGLTTFEQIIDFTLPHHLTPLITPELKHITIGGALVGIGVETNTFRYGFVHNSLLEADVLLSNGKVITVSRNKNKDLFDALPNSYGTLGYVLRAKIKLRDIKPFVKLKTKKYKNIKKALSELNAKTKQKSIDTIEAIAYSKNEIYITLTEQTNKPKNLKSIYGPTIFYKEVSRANEFTLKTKDFFFRYDPDWFWNIPDNFLMNLLRRITPKKLRNSGFYKKYGQPIFDSLESKESKEKYEALIQDWEVPWNQGEKLFNFFFDIVETNGNPIIIAPIKTPTIATLYPMKPDQLYLNLGCYCAIKRKKGQKPFDVTKKIDNLCFRLGGIKMLYSSTFLNKKEFDKIYNGGAYDKLKKKYDPLKLLPTLFEKATLHK